MPIQGRFLVSIFQCRSSRCKPETVTTLKPTDCTASLPCQTCISELGAPEPLTSHRLCSPLFRDNFPGLAWRLTWPGMAEYSAHPITCFLPLLAYCIVKDAR